MKTTAIGIENLCVPCRAACKYCLLSSCQRATGVGYGRGREFARRFYEELKKKRPDLGFFYYIGYCMDTPDLGDYIRFCQETGSPSGRFLQLNGLSFRDEGETERFLQMVKSEGVERFDLTFYGTRDYHDRFAGRAGDFDFLLRILSAASRVGLTAEASLPLTEENLSQADELLEMLEPYGLGATRIFLPHSKGRGRVLNDARLTKAEFDGLSEGVRARFSRLPHRTEGEWMAAGEWPTPDSRTLILCLTQDNIKMLGALSVEEIVCYLEGLDDEYYAAVPPIGELAERYGDKGSDRVYRLRDLHLKWQQMYLADHPGIYDMNEESHHFSVRI